MLSCFVVTFTKILGLLGAANENALWPNLQKMNKYISGKLAFLLNVDPD